MKNCSVEGCNNPVWSKGVCNRHIQRKPLSMSKKAHRLQKESMGKKIVEYAFYRFFLKIWESRPHESEVSGTCLVKEPLSIYFHHILPKSKYPELAYDESNIILLTLDEHTNVETDMYKYEEVNRRRIQLLNKINQ